jgi:outer membrane autotransporter protein
MKANVKTERRDGQNLRHQSAVGLLLLALLVANPLQGFSQSGVISSSSTTGVYLNSLFGSPTNSVTVNPGVTINNSGSGNDAVSGDTYSWYLGNHAAVLNGSVNGVNFNAGGSVDNEGGIIGGGQYGVQIGGDMGYVTNTSIISGNSRDGVGLWDGGTVDNEGGIIEGSFNGVDITGNTGTVINAGWIIGTNRAGVYLGVGGTVNNLTNASITGRGNGVNISGGAGTVINAGTITGTHADGVYMNQGGSVDNLSGGSIAGNLIGVEITGGAGYVTNAGSISSGGIHAGVYLFDGGTVDNESGGSIMGGGNGVRIDGDWGHVYNDGSSISGNFVNGVYLTAGGTVHNENDATILGYNDGVEITGNWGHVKNYGSSITGIYGDGVYLGDGGTVENRWDGSIVGYDDGVDITGNSGHVKNYGSSITGINGFGVYLGDGGSVENKWGGTISGNMAGVAVVGDGSVNNRRGGSIQGGGSGVSIYGGTGSVVNAGSIIGQTYDGVYMDTNGSVNNWRSGTITGGTNEGANGVTIHGTGSVVNAGSIMSTSTNGVGVGLGDGGSVENRWGGTISGNVAGVAIVGGGSVDNEAGGTITGNGYGVVITNGTGYVTNERGTITGNTEDGVRLWDGGTVDNERHGTIAGYLNGVEIDGSEGYVHNDGYIYGGPNPEGISASATPLGTPEVIGTGVYMAAGGSVDNKRRGTIEGYYYGVYIDGGPGTVVNSGTIIGDGGTAILLGNYSNTVTLKTGSDVQGDIVGGITGTNAAFLLGHGSYSDNFVNFETLTVDASNWRGGWNLTGTNIFSTNVTVESGLLSVNGELTTPVVTVSSDATLGGSGIINGAVGIHGIISPGNSIGTLNIVGSLNMTNAIYDEQVNAAGQSDLINVSGSPGTAIISNATVVVQTAREIYGAQTIYTNLTATGGVIGTNAGVSIVLPTLSPYTNLFLTASLQYPNANIVTMTLDRSPFVSVANTYNQHSVAGALDGIVDSLPAGMTNLVTEFFWLPSASAAQAALDSMSGEIHGTLGMLDVQQQDAFNRSVSLRTGRISAGGENGGYASAKPIQLANTGSTLPPMQSDASQLLDNIWLQGFGSFGHLDGDGNALGGAFTISGVNGGFDYRLSPEMLVGLAVGYSHDSATVGGVGASGKVDAIQFAGYGGYVSGPWHLDGIFSYGFLQTDTKRFIDVGSIHQEADGSYDGGVFSLSTEGGYVFKFDRVTIEPTLGLKYAHLSQDSFNETGTAAYDGNNYGLSVNSVDMDSLRTALGVRLAAQFGKKDGVQFIPEVRAGWEHEFMDKTADVNARFVGGSGDFNVRGVELGADSGVLGAGLTVAFTKSIQGFVNYDANLNSRLSSHAISGGLSYSW